AHPDGDDARRDGQRHGRLRAGLQRVHHEARRPRGAAHQGAQLPEPAGAPPMKSGDGELRILRAELLDAHRELVRLRSQLEQMLASNRDLSSLLSSSAQRTGELVKIIVALRRLLAANDAGAAVRSIEEILINVIGTEDFVLMLHTDAASMPLCPV